MLQRAASNAYSWWWVSHIRTKQSKWLEQSLQDMEEKVNETLQIINEDGDTFARRAEMYYKRRPELVNMVEESFRAYRALAERYDHLSKDLQSANRTIATVCPEQVQFALDEEEEEESSPPQIPDIPQKPYEEASPSIPIAPKTPDRNFKSPFLVFSKTGQIKRSPTSVKATVPSSGLSEIEALKEIDRLQKGILGLQTEKEFVKSSFEQGYTKYWEIEKNITDIQENIIRLQDEFDICTILEDSEARSLIAAAALKSCEDALVKLQEKHALSAEEARTEYHKIKESHDKLENIIYEFVSKYGDPIEFSERSESLNSSHDAKELHLNITFDDHGVVQDTKEHDVNLTSLSATEVVEKIDDLVDKVVTLTTAVSSQNALVKRLSGETDELQSHIRNLEEGNDLLIEGSDNMRNKLHKLEEELHGVKNLNRSVEDQYNNLQTCFSLATGNLHRLSEKLQTVKLNEEEEDGKFSPEVEAVQDAKHEEEIKEHKYNSPVEITNVIQLVTSSSDAMDSTEVNKPQCSQLFVDGLDTEKALVDDYTSILHNYKQVKMKLSEVEMKSQESFFELTMQLKELKDANASREEEIQFLEEKLALQTNPDENQDLTSATYSYSQKGGPQESITHNSPSSNILSLASPAISLSSEHNVSWPQSISRSTGRQNVENQQAKEEEHDMKVDRMDKPRAISADEERIRTDINELLGENLVFWLKFSSSIHQIQKFQSSVQDLKEELTKLKNNKREDGFHISDARPIYRQLREIQTEVTLWLGQSALLKDELNSKFSSLRSIEEAISRVSCADSGGKEAEDSKYKAAKYQGEILNMKKEIIKIADELKASLSRVGLLKTEVEKILTEELHPQMKSGTSRRIPLRSFLFGAKLKKQKKSVFSCANPLLQKQYSDLTAAAQHPL